MKNKEEKKLTSITGHNKIVSILLTSIVVLLILCFFFKKLVFLLLVLVVIAAIVIIRLFSGRLRAAEGEIVYIWGQKGCGKTMLEVKTATELKRDGWNIAGNNEFCEVTDICDYQYDKHHMGFFAPLEHTAYFIDEASLSGYDNRSWATNFQSIGALDFFKKCRHNRCAIFISNQGWNEIDAKIRDTLTNTIYYVENRGFYSVATRMDSIADFDWETGQPVDCYTFPSFFDRLRDPSCQIYFLHSKYGKLYKSWHPTSLPPITDIDKYFPTYNKHGDIVSWSLLPPLQGGNSQGVSDTKSVSNSS